MASKYANLYLRLVANTVEPESVNGCWCWTGHVDRYGYGRVNVRVEGEHRKLQAHKAMAEIVFDRKLDPENETIEHLCAVKHCINPDHFALLTRAENSAARWTRRVEL